MTYFYELRSFNHKGECFDVREYGKQADAMNRFDAMVATTKNVRQALIAKGLTTAFLATEMQLVKRDDNYLGLEELANWKAGA